MAVSPTRGELLGCLSVPRWADELVAAAPYPDAEALLRAASAAAAELTDDELDEALAGHPRIGEHGGASSRAEQAGVATSAASAIERLARGNAAYEARFGRVFLIRAAGRDAEQILGELERRLGNDEATERAETVSNLREIALLRLKQIRWEQT